MRTAADDLVVGRPTRGPALTFKSLQLEAEATGVYTSVEGG